MATPAMAPATTPIPNRGNNRGKDQIQWGEGVWKALDHAVIQEMMRTRVAAKFLPPVHVDKKQTTVPSDVVNLPALGAASSDAFLSVDEAATNRIQEYWVQFRMSVAQVEKEEHDEASDHPQSDLAHVSKLHAVEPGGGENHRLTQSHRASTGVSLAMRTANILAQAEDLVLFNGRNAVANSPLFQTKWIQALDQNLQKNLDLGLLNISETADITLPADQVVFVHPAKASMSLASAAGAGSGSSGGSSGGGSSTGSSGGSSTGTSSSGDIRYAENTLNAVAEAFSKLQAKGHYEHYALALHTVPYADMHEALATTLIEPVEPISHLIKAGIHGTGTLPPFSNSGDPSAPGLPKTIPTKQADGSFKNQPIPGNVLYTGLLVSLSGNTMDHVRGRMDDDLDVIVTFNQKDANEQYRFRVVERFCLRLKDPTAVILLLFMDS